MSTLRANMLLIAKRMRTDELEQYKTAMPMSALLFCGGAATPPQTTDELSENAALLACRRGSRVKSKKRFCWP
jgi:hypothetical protein